MCNRDQRRYHFSNVDSVVMLSEAVSDLTCRSCFQVNGRSTTPRYTIVKMVTRIRYLRPQLPPIQVYISLHLILTFLRIFGGKENICDNGIVVSELLTLFSPRDPIPHCPSSGCIICAV